MGSIFATDFSIVDLEVPKSIVENSDFNITIKVANTASISKTVNLKIELFNPGTEEDFSVIRPYDLSSNDITPIVYNFEEVPTVASNAQSIIRVSIVDQDGSLTSSKNIINKYFIVTKAPKKVAIPDLPLTLGLLSGLVIGLIFLIYDKRSEKE